MTSTSKKCYQLFKCVQVFWRTDFSNRELTSKNYLLSDMLKPAQTFGAIFLLTASAAAPASAQNTPPAAVRNSNQQQRQAKPSDVQIKNFRSLTLRQALDLADKNNREIEAARLQTDRSVAAIREAQAAESVTVSIDGSLTNTGAPVISNVPNSNVGTPLRAGIEADYAISTAGRNSSRVKAAREQLNFDQLEVDRIARRVRSDVITAYYDLQEADEQLKINMAAVTNSERSLRDAKLQEQAGLGTKFDVIRAEVQKATAEQDVVRTVSQQQNARKRIAQILNITETVEYNSSEEVAPRGKWDISLENSIVLAYGNRPELKQSAVRRNIGEQNAKEAAAGDQAQFSLFARYDLGKDFQQSVGFADNYSVGARVRWDFLDGGASSSRVAQAKASQLVADTQYITSRDQIRLQVEQAYNNLNADRQNIITSTGAQKQAEESLRLARLRFAAGVGTQTDVISADTELTRAKSNRLRAIVGYNRSLSTLRNAVYVNQF
jgi:outer membrane protein TolC